MGNYHVPRWALKAIAFSSPLSLFGLSFLDATVLPFPSLNDLLLIDLCIQAPARMPYYAILATLGSVAGSVLLYLSPAKEKKRPSIRRRVRRRRRSIVGWSAMAS